MPRQHSAELLEGRQPLPPERQEPVGEAAAPGGRVRGRTEARAATREVNIVLMDPSRVLSFEKTAKLGEAFDFNDVLPGTYRLTVEDPEIDTPLWDVEVTVTAGQETVLDLK